MVIVGLGSSLMHRNKDVGGNGCKKRSIVLNIALYLPPLEEK